MDPQKIGKFILELRKEKNLSQYQLADMIPISRQAVSKWERGKTTPDSLTLLKLSEIFNVTINELLIGERLLDNSIEELEETTLSIVDESNKKAKTIKHNLIIFSTIIGILLLSFLSYYFINSYNSIHIYRVATDNGKFYTTDGILILTKSKYYLKLGEIKSNNNTKINNVRLYYKKGSDEHTILEDSDMENLTIIDTYGYEEILKINRINNLLDKLYIDIYYEDNQKDTIKLEFKKDFNNSELFSKKGKMVAISKEVDKEDKNKTENKEESKDESKEETKEETKQTINTNQNNTSQTQKETPKVEEPVKEPITPERIISKITTEGDDTGDGYMYTFDDEGNSIIVIYFDSIKQISIYKNEDFVGDYFTNEARHSCFTSGCESYMDHIFEKLLS